MAVAERAPRRRVRALAFALLLCAPGLLLSVAAPRHAAAAGPVATATPNTNLGDQQWVKMSMSGFPALAGLAGFRQCVANPVNVKTDCNNRGYYNAFNVNTDANGAAFVYLPVYANGDPQLGNAAHGLIVCDGNHPCVIAVLGDATDLVGAVFVPLTFAPATTDCPSPGDNAAFGTGSATAYQAIYRWQTAVCGPPSNTPIVYGVSNSIDGIDNFGAGQSQANFGVTGPVPPFTLPPGAPSYALAPITSSALVIGYRMFDSQLGTQITDLTLTPYEIAQIFLSNVVDMNADAGIRSLNPGVTFPHGLLPIVRAEHSAETWVFTSWLNATLGPGVWKTGGAPIGAQTIFPTAVTDVHISGSRALANHVQDPSGATQSGSSGLIGFMDSSTAAYYGLPTVRIRMPNGGVVGATPASIAQGVSLATQNADGTYTPDYTPTDPTAYPMSYPSYMLVPTNQIAGDPGRSLQSFVKYAVQQGQSNLPQGYAPLPAIMVNQALAAAAQIPTTGPGSGTGSSGGGGPGGAGSDSSSGGGDLGLNPSLGLSGAGVNGLATDAGAGGPGGAGSGSKPGAGTATAAVPAGVLLSGSIARWLLLGIAGLAVVGVAGGPVGYVIARKRHWSWPPHPLRHIWRLLRLRTAGAMPP
jgi:phosphate transport system substrate-binding protein